MQVLFTEITRGDIDAVRARLDKHPEQLELVATGKPKKFAGKTPLMVAFADWQFAIAALLLERGADSNAVQVAGTNYLTAPVLHSAVTAAVFNARWSGCAAVTLAVDPRTAREREDRADVAWSALHLLLQAGADPNAVDNYGNTAIGRAAIDARQVLPQHIHSDPEFVPRPIRPEIVDDLSRIFADLLAHGADPYASEGPTKRSIAVDYREEHVGKILLGVLDRDDDAHAGSRSGTGPAASA